MRSFKLSIYITAISLLISSYSQAACVYLQATIYLKMCNGPTCGYPKPINKLVLVNFDSSGKAILSETYQNGPLQIQYSLKAQNIPQRKALYLVVSTAYLNGGRPFLYTEKSDFVYNTRQFQSLELQGQPYIKNGYLWTPFMKISPEPDQRECKLY